MIGRTAVRRVLLPAVTEVRGSTGGDQRRGATGGQPSSPACISCERLLMRVWSVTPCES
jgi:hypothetical protein